MIAGTEALGWERPSALQEAAAPVIRRGNNVVLHGSHGAGVTGAWGIPVLDRLMAFEDASGPSGLVLTPSTADASRTAGVLARLGGPAGVSVGALAPGWTDRPTRLLVASAADAMSAVRDSRLKLDGVSILVISGVDAITAAGGWNAVETMTELLPGEAQRVVVTGALSAALDSYVERHARRAMTLPSRPADRAERDTSASVRYAIAAESDRLDALVALLPRFRRGEAAVVCRTRDRAEEVAEGLVARGVDLDALDGEDGLGRVLVLPLSEADQRTTRALVISYDVPFDAESLAELHANGGLVLVAASELQHLLVIGNRVEIQPEPLPLPEPGHADRVEAARDRIRKVLEEVDLAAYLALVEPLLEERPAGEVAAAAAYLAREDLVRAPGTVAAREPVAEAPAASAVSTPAGAPPPSTAYVRLFLTIGSRDGVGPGDVVGAITGESGISGDSVGRIDIRESHTTVEVATGDAQRVISSLNGRTLRGRSLRVDYDRKDRSPGAPARG
ncbi:MAG TPA: DEAD/DEAH box helicase, partial [Longimicrobiales bacterium]|nr:DEAD/DEAH box helicase [Longimicrobiales bacterium]